MAAQWFVLKGQKEYGPYSATDIRTYATEGKINPETRLRKSDGDTVILAGKLKGLFPDAQPAEEEPQTDPLIAMGSQAASSVANAASNAASAVTGWFKNPSIPEPKIAAPGEHFAFFTRDNQPADIVATVHGKVSGILMGGEEITYIAVQNKPIVNWFPDCVALTNKRFILYRPKILGRVDFEDFVWRELRDVQLAENMIGATITAHTNKGPISLDYLPKAQARAIYRIAQDMEEAALNERRARQLEEARARAGGMTVHVPAQAPAPAPAPAAEDPIQTLQKLKAMMDAGLITAAEFDAKKADILSRM